MAKLCVTGFPKTHQLVQKTIKANEENIFLYLRAKFQSHLTMVTVIEKCYYAK